HQRLGRRAETLGIRSEQNHRLSRGGGFDGLREIATGHHWHEKVGDYEVKFAGLKHGEGLFSAACFIHEMPLKLEDHAQCFTNQRFVIHDENMSFNYAWFTHRQAKSAIGAPIPLLSGLKSKAGMPHSLL